MSSPPRTTTTTNTTTTTTTDTTTPSVTKEPTGWNDTMAAFVRQQLDNGEEARSAIILLETEFPQMTDRVSVAWIEEVRKGGGGSVG